MINEINKDVDVSRLCSRSQCGKGFIQAQLSQGMGLGVYLETYESATAVKGGNAGGAGTTHRIADQTAHGRKVVNVVFGFDRALFPGMQHLFKLGLLGLNTVQDKIIIDRFGSFYKPKNGLPFNVDSPLLDGPMNVECQGNGPPVVELSPQGGQDLWQVIVTGISQTATTGFENPSSEARQIFVQPKMFLGIGRIGEDEINAVVLEITVRVPEIFMMKDERRILVGFDLFQTFDYSSFFDFHLPFFNGLGQGGVLTGQQSIHNEILNAVVFDLGKFEQSSGLGSKGSVTKLVFDFGRKILSDPLLLDDGVHADRHLISKILEGWKFSVGVGSSSRASGVAQLCQDLITRKKMFADFNVVEFVSLEVFVQFNETRPRFIQLHYLAVDCCTFEEFGCFKTMIAGQKLFVRCDSNGVDESDLVDGLGEIYYLVRIKAAKTFTDNYLFHGQRLYKHGTRIFRARIYVQINIRTVLVFIREYRQIKDICDLQSS